MLGLEPRYSHSKSKVIFISRPQIYLWKNKSGYFEVTFIHLDIVKLNLSKLDKNYIVILNF